jgi:hypothetical protein
MKLLLTIILIICSLSAKSIEEWEEVFTSLTIQERSNLVKTFVRGIPYDLSYTLTAIALKESTAGRYYYNINNKYSIDVGIFQINSAEYLRRQALEINRWNTSRALEELRDYETNFSEAILTLMSCIKKANGDWKKAWGYYNQWGNGGNKEYSEDIYNIIQVLNKYFSIELYNKHKEKYLKEN